MRRMCEPRLQLRATMMPRGTSNPEVSSNEKSSRQSRQRKLLQDVLPQDLGHPSHIHQRHHHQKQYPGRQIVAGSCRSSMINRGTRSRNSSLAKLQVLSFFSHFLIISVLLLHGGELGMGNWFEKQNYIFRLNFILKTPQKVQILGYLSFFICCVI